MSEQTTGLREEARLRILRLLEQNPELSQRDLASKTGISTGSTHYVLRSMVSEGLVKLGNFSGAADKRRYAYVLTPRGLSEKTALTRLFLLRKRAEFEALKAEIGALESEMSAPGRKTGE